MLCFERCLAQLAVLLGPVLAATNPVLDRSDFEEGLEIEQLRVLRYSSRRSSTSIVQEEETGATRARESVYIYYWEFQILLLRTAGTNYTSYVEY